MATVAQLREYLKDLPDDAEVVVSCSYFGYEPGTEWRELDLDPYMGNADLLTSNGQSTLYLGET